MLKRHAAASGKTIKVFGPPQIRSILKKDPSFEVQEPSAERVAESQGARSPLAVLRHALADDLLNRKFRKIETGHDRQSQAAGLEPRIGIAWASKQTNEKSVPAEHFLRILSGLDCTLISFQRMPTASETESIGRLGYPCEYWDTNDLDGEDQSKIVRSIEALTCMVTISTTTAHMAASLGIPVVLIAAKRLHHQWFWRTQAERRKIFYPSVRVIMSSQRKGDWWAECIEAARQALAEILADANA